MINSSMDRDPYRVLWDVLSFAFVLWMIFEILRDPARAWREFRLMLRAAACFAGLLLVVWIGEAVYGLLDSFLPAPVAGLLMKLAGVGALVGGTLLVAALRQRSAERRSRIAPDDEELVRTLEALQSDESPSLQDSGRRW